MISALYSLFTGRDSRWPACRKRHLAKHPACAACGTLEELDVHHVEPFEWYPERELDDTNLLTLCRRCHLFVGHLGCWSSYNPEAVRDAATWLRKVLCRPRKEPPANFGF